MNNLDKDSRRGFIKITALSAVAFTIDPSKIIGDRVYEGPEMEMSNGIQERTLFGFDDYSIPWKHNLKITLVEAKKYSGNPVVKTGPRGAPDHGHAILYGTVIKEGRKYRMWYLAMGQTYIQNNGQAPGYWRPMCYAESEDGINWVKPELGLVEFNGNKRNNICLIEGSPSSLTLVDDFLSVLYEPDDPDPSRKYKVAYIAHVPYKDIYGGMSNVGPELKRVCSMICATSGDGLRWKVVGNRPANAGGENFEVSSLHHFGDFYYATGQVYSPFGWLPNGDYRGRVMMGYRSPDFIHWSKARSFSFARCGQRINPPVKGEQTHMGAGIWNRNNVLLGLYGMWQSSDKRSKEEFRLTGTQTELGLILSNDGIHFREPATDFKVITCGKQNEWDHISVLQGNAFVNDGDETKIWYSSWDTSGRLRTMEIGLATLRRDGFGYLSLMELDNDALFITTTLEAGSKEKLIINVEGLTPETPLRIELLDHLDKPLKNYSGGQAAVIHSNGTQVEVSWQGRNYLPVNRKFAIRVIFPANSNAKMYALYLRPS